LDLSGLSLQQMGAAKAVVQKCIHSRLYFVKEILGAELERWQEEVIAQLDRGETKISIRSGHGVGKTMLCAVLALHFLCFRDDVKIIVTAPSADQMKDGLIPEINKWKNRLPNWMSKSLEATSERMVRYPSPSNNFISFRTARKENPEALAGVHATHVMIIVDEASGVDEAIYETGQGALSTEGAIALLIGNPTNPSGFFFKTQTTLSNLWWTRKVSCSESSRVDPNYIINMARTYGVDSREYRVRVLGEFPDSGADAVVPRAFAEAALGRDISTVSGDVVWGVDPGRGGDPTGFTERSANAVVDLKELNYVDLMNTVGWIKRRWDESPPRFRPTAIYVDSIGLGAGVADRLLEMDLPVIHVNVSEAASISERFVNLRAELWYKVREWLERKDVKITQMDLSSKLIEELVAVNQKFTSLGKVQIESKQEMKKRGVPSPNLADSLCLTFMDDSGARIGQYDHGWGSVDMSKFKVPGVTKRRR
jgi:phage terminase large subunit